jgi:hypothetical protein
VQQLWKVSSYRPDDATDTQITTKRKAHGFRHVFGRRRFVTLEHGSFFSCLDAKVGRRILQDKRLFHNKTTWRAISDFLPEYNELFNTIWQVRSELTRLGVGIGEGRASDIRSHI